MTDYTRSRTYAFIDVRQAQVVRRQRNGSGVKRAAAAIAAAAAVWLVCSGIALLKQSGTAEPDIIRTAERHTEPYAAAAAAVTDEATAADTAAVYEMPDTGTGAADTAAEAVYGFVELDIPLSAELQRYLYDACVENGVDYAFALGLAECESSFRTDVVSKTNDYGLFQINAINAEWLAELGYDDMLDPRDNIDAAMYILGDYIEKCGDIALAAMAYNLGETGAARSWESGVYTNKYASRVEAARLKYAALLSDAAS